MGRRGRKEGAGTERSDVQNKVLKSKVSIKKVGSKGVISDRCVRRIVSHKSGI